MQILVLGMHRSGTSAVTRIINMLGAYFGPEGRSAGWTPDNPKGHWERQDFMQLNRQLLAQRNSNWCRVEKWEAGAATPLPPKLKGAMRRAILELDAHRPWVLKDPRFCITLGEWLALLEVPVAVVVSRDPREVARSLETRDALPYEYGLALWEYHAVSIVRHAAALSRVFVSHDAMLAAPVATTRRLFDGLVAAGVRRLDLPHENEILAFIDPKLHRASVPAGAGLSPHRLRLHAMLRGETPFDPAVAVSEESREVTARLGDRLVEIAEARAPRAAP